MKRYLVTLALVLLVIPSLAFASWWKPTSWFYNWTFYKPHNIEKILETEGNVPLKKPSASTPKTTPASSLENTSSQNKPTGTTKTTNTNQKPSSPSPSQTVQAENVTNASGNADTDYDGMTNSFEVENGYNPKKDEKKEAESISISSCDSEKGVKTVLTVLNHSFTFDWAWAICVDNIAKKNDNIFVCDNIAGQARDPCYDYFAKQRKSPAICSRMEGDNAKACYYELAFLTKNVNLCEKTADTNALSMAGCYEQYAVYFNQPSICEQVASLKDSKLYSEILSNCYSFFGNIKSDISYCDKAEAVIPGGGSRCYYNLALATHNTSYCGKIISTEQNLYPYKGCSQVSQIEDACFEEHNGVGTYAVSPEWNPVGFLKEFKYTGSPVQYCLDGTGDFGGMGRFINGQRAAGNSDATIRSVTFINGQEQVAIDAYFKAADRLLNK